MRKLSVLLALFCLVAPLPVGAFTQEDSFTTGKDWVEHMSKREKFISLLPPSLIFSQQDVQLHHDLLEYIYWIDKILLKNPQFEKEDVSNIFASTIYFAEPENRPALRNMEESFLRGNYEMKGGHWPRLSIQEVLREISPQS